MQAVNQSYETALNNFGGLLSNYGDFFGGLLSGAQNATVWQHGSKLLRVLCARSNACSRWVRIISSLQLWRLQCRRLMGRQHAGGATSGGNTGHRQLWTM